MADSSLEHAETIDSPSPLQTALPKSSGNWRPAARGLVALVGSDTPHMTSETRDLLRRRLRAAAALLFGGFAAFLLRGIFLEEHRSAPGWLFPTHCMVTAVMGLTVGALSLRREISLGKLRLAELAVFGAAAAFFVVLNQAALSHAANLADNPHLPIVVVPWLCLIFTYALFIPNTWRRAAMVLTPMAVAPIAVIKLQHAACNGFQACVERPVYAGYITEQAMEMTLAVLTATIGVHTINNLRQVAFEAKQLGQYRLKHKLGAGGMGEVYLAEHQMMKRPCAVKVIRPEKAGDAQVLARFEREVRSTAKLSHWNSVDIYDYGSTADGTFYYVMEYLPGHNIGELVEGYGPMPAGRAIYLMSQVCQALAEAHSTGLVHRDIKPANIFSAYRGGEFDVAKLLDFGLAKPILDSGDTMLTQEGAITGSPLFMSPEQATGEREADARSDIYSLGAVMYYLLTGRPPFEHKQAVKVIVAHVSEEVVPPRELVPEIPIGLEDIVLRCLEKDADHRFQDVPTLRQALLDLDEAADWSSDRAAEWWSCHGCPERKAMAAAVIEAAAKGDSCPWPGAEAMEPQPVAAH